MSLKITIVYANAAGEGQRWVFDGKAPIRLGRLADNDVVFAEEAHRPVSGHHAEIRDEGGKVFIFDNHSLNGLYVGGQKVTDARLTSGAKVRLGTAGPTITVNIEETASATDTVVVPRQPAKKYGDRTVGMLIQRALAQAGLLKPKGTAKSTEYFEKMVEDRVQKSGRRLKWIVAVAALLTVLGGAGFGIYLYRNRSVQYIQQTQVNYGEAVGGSVAAANRYTVFLMAGVSEETGGYQGFCTAFALSVDVLATNAHCVEQALHRFSNPVVLMNGMPARSYPILRAAAHPGFRDGQISSDVGLIRIQGRLPYAVTLADETELRQVLPGMTVFLYGFPGRLNNVSAPEATFVTGEIGRVTGLSQSPGSFAENVLIQHSAFTSAGTSGSPLFNGKGHVIGINTGGYTENGQALTGYNFGLRIDTVYSLLQQI